MVTTDSYNYFGRDPAYLDEKLLPFVKPGGYIYIAIPGMKQENEYAIGDRKSMKAGGGKYLNFIKIVLRKKV